MEHIKQYSDFLNEASLDRDAMMKWVKKYIDSARTTEEFRKGDNGGIWVTGEDPSYTYKGLPIYDYYASTKSYELGVLSKWEKELNKRGWYSEWHDPGTVMIWPL